MTRILVVILISTLAINSYGQIGWDEYKNACKECDFPYQDSIKINSKKKNLQLNKSDWLKLGLNKLEDFDKAYHYSIICKLLTSELNLYIIAKESTEEIKHWTCMINHEGKLEDFKLTAYENSEGFLTIHSVIYKNKIMTTEINQFVSSGQVERITNLEQDQ